MPFGLLSGSEDTDCVVEVDAAVVLKSWFVTGAFGKTKGLLVSPEPKDERVSKGFLVAEGAGEKLLGLKSVDTAGDGSARGAAGASLGLAVSGGFVNENGEEETEVLKLGVNTELEAGAAVGVSVATNDETWELLD